MSANRAWHVGCSLSLLGLVGFGAFALIALALALLGLCDLSLVIFQRTTDTFVEVKARRRFMGQETLRKRGLPSSCAPVAALGPVGAAAIDSQVHSSRTPNALSPLWDRES